MFYIGVLCLSFDEFVVFGFFEMKVFWDYVGLVSESFFVVNSEFVIYYNVSCSIIYDF